MMIDLIKKAFYTGLGAAELTREKVEDLARELADKGKVSDSEIKKFVDEMLDKSQERKDQLLQQVEKVTEDVLKKMNLASRDDLDALEKRLAEMIQKSQEKSAGE
ncbi:MAG: polyhydroxyalkanoate synthesis regulator [Proteobacteria bacterium]|nr:polyhydroxyalkanoate synthesis regulator [Pseudomonadota bacterium]MBU0967362.1 polyhydroxyalkanoate synthesis regulator [Pseudomonadota bacterium]